MSSTLSGEDLVSNIATRSPSSRLVQYFLNYYEVYFMWKEKYYLKYWAFEANFWELLKSGRSLLFLKIIKWYWSIPLYLSPGWFRTCVLLSFAYGKPACDLQMQLPGDPPPPIRHSTLSLNPTVLSNYNSARWIYNNGVRAFMTQLIPRGPISWQSRLAHRTFRSACQIQPDVLALAPVTADPNCQLDWIERNRNRLK